MDGDDLEPFRAVEDDGHRKTNPDFSDDEEGGATPRAHHTAASSIGGDQDGDSAHHPVVVVGNNHGSNRSTNSPTNKGGGGSLSFRGGMTTSSTTTGGGGIAITVTSRSSTANASSSEPSAQQAAASPSPSGGGGEGEGGGAGEGGGGGGSVAEGREGAAAPSTSPMKSATATGGSKPVISTTSRLPPVKTAKLADVAFAALVKTAMDSGRGGGGGPPPDSPTSTTTASTPTSPAAPPPTNFTTSSSLLRTTLNDAIKKQLASSLRGAGGGGKEGGLSGGGVTTSTVGHSKHLFTVSKDEMEQLRENAIRKMNRVNWGRGRAMASLKLDTETLVEGYVELVCHDLRTEQKQENQVQRRWIFDPQANRRIQWDFVVLTVIAVIAIVIPYRTSFGYTEGIYTNTRDAFVNFVLVADIVIRSRTAYYESDGVIQVKPKKIIKRYMRGWFAVDVLSALPLEAFAVTRPWSLLRLVKLLQFFTFTNSVAESKAVAILISPTVFRLTLTVAILFWVWHVITCSYWYISVYEGLGSTPWTPPAEVAFKGALFNYMESFVWTLEATFSCSPGNPPETDLEAAFSIVAVLVGIFMNATVIGSANTTLQSLDATNSAKRQRMERVVEYMKRRNLPVYFQRIILDFYQYVSEKTTDEGILLDLPPAIQGRLSLLLNRELVKTIPLLKSLELSTIISLMQTLQHRMVMPGEFIFKAGEKGERIFFVKKGQLELLLPEHILNPEAATTSTCGSLRTGDMVGMVALTANQPHEFSARAMVYSEMLYLEKEVYEELSKESDKFQELVEMEAIKQENLISKAKKNLARSDKLGRMGQSTKGDLTPPNRANEALKKKAIAVGRLMRNLKSPATSPKPSSAPAAPSSKVLPDMDEDDS